MVDQETPINIALAAVIISAAIVGLSKWDVFYDKKTGSLRNFGTKGDETLFPAWMAMMAAGYLVYMMAFRSKRTAEGIP